jgi:DNA-binding response OmpR family regulator
MNSGIPNKILVVEDDALTLKALEFRLRKEGYQIIVAPDGARAKELLLTESFDLMITDLMLPFINGIELVELAKHQLEKPLPVIVLSAANQEEVVLDAFNIGADDFMAKPFSPNELTVRVKRLIKR